MQTLRWMRVPGDTVFAIGALVLVWFVFAGRAGKPHALAARPYPVPVAGD
jgi:nitric oxide reductase subunit B